MILYIIGEGEKKNKRIILQSAIFVFSSSFIFCWYENEKKTQCDIYLSKMPGAFDQQGQYSNYNEIRTSFKEKDAAELFK